MSTNQEKNYSALKLFKSYIGELENTIDRELFHKGILIPANAPEDVKNLAVQYYGIDSEELNNTFHKDYHTVANSDLSTLIMQQLINYITTYGFESLGIPADAYVPNEKIDIIEVAKIFTILTPASEIELNTKAEKLAYKNIAFSSSTIKTLKPFFDILDIERISNKELRIAWYKYSGVVPTDAEEFLRFIIYQATGNTLKIKNRLTLQSIKFAFSESQSYSVYEDTTDLHKNLSEQLHTYINNNGYKPLAKIFYRNKPFFLAMKNSATKSIINKIRKLAYKYYVPMKPTLISTLTNKQFSKEELQDFKKQLTTIPIYKLFALYNTITYARTEYEANLYRIRNGKAFFKENITTTRPTDLEDKNNLIFNEIKSRINFKNKVFYIPESISYGLPISEKNFIGNVPEGTTITLPTRKSNLVIGIHWVNKNGKRTDLDLHATDENGTSYGWNHSYRDNNKQVLFTGDMTDAPKPKGASEYYFVDKNYSANMLLSITDFTSRGKVPYDIIIAKADHDKDDLYNYVVNPNEILFKMPSVCEHSSTIGNIKLDNKITVTLMAQTINNGIGGMNSELSQKIYKTTNEKQKLSLTLNELIILCGGQIISNKTGIKKDQQEIIDLSLETISKDTIINLLKNDDENKIC